MSARQEFYLSAKMTAPAAARDALVAHLTELGALGFQEIGDALIAYFPDRDTADLMRALQERLALLRSSGLPVASQEIELNRFAGENWQENWKRYFRPQRIGGLLYVRPPWEPPAPAGWIDLQIEPKQAFGTGTHATTRLVLEAIVRRRGQLPLRALDVGAGSGILAIAHALLEPEAQLVGVDIDPVAVENARENARLNGVADRCRFSSQPLFRLSEPPFPLIYANLEKRIIFEILEAMLQHAAPGSEILFSGVLQRELAEVEEFLQKHAVNLLAVRREEEWVLLETKVTSARE